jgi:serine/threonine protein kinase
MYVHDQTGRLVRHAADEEPIPGYRLLEPLGRGGFGEVWKCLAPGGLHKAIKFVRGGVTATRDTDHAQQELRAMERIKSIRHPFLLTTERLELIDDELVIVMELADRSLLDVLHEYRNRNNPGIPRQELLRYLREAAEVLDLLNMEYGITHLDIKPSNIFQIGKHVKVADFGLASRLEDLNELDSSHAGLTPLYAAPETFHGKITPFSDQYSLAITYVELLTGRLPFLANSLNHLIHMVCNQAPDLEGLPPEDRAIVARALAKNPQERFPHCLQFVEELLAAGHGEPLRHLRATVPSSEYEFNELATTPGAKVTNSGLYRRKSRILPAVRPTPEPAFIESISGYQLVDSLGRGPSGELWRARNSQGAFCLLRFLTLPPGSVHPEGLDRLLHLRHPNLPMLRTLPAGPERIALIAPLGTGSLGDRFRECHTAGMPGIPRPELLHSLAIYAEALDELYHLHEMQHLMLSPRHLVYSSTEQWILEFGMAECLWLPRGLQPAQLSPRYSAPELFEGMVSDACDQYSLALLYQELLVGLHPFRNLNARQMANPRMRGSPDVSLLPGPDRAVVLQALSDDPQRRFRSCREFILALEEVGRSQGTIITPKPSFQGLGLPAAVDALAETTGLVATWKDALAELVTVASRLHEVRTVGLISYRLCSAQHLEYRAMARVPAGMVRLKLDGFREQWQAQEVGREDRRYTFHLQTQVNLWDRCLGRAPGLQVEVRIGTADPITGLSPVRVRLDPVDCNRHRAEQVLNELGLTVLGSLQSFLHTQSEKAQQERYPLTHSVVLKPTGSLQTLDTTLRDIGHEGLCVLSRSPVGLGPVEVRTTRWNSLIPVVLPGRVVDCFAQEGGQYEIEIRMG